MNKILLVDDDRELTSLLKELLEMEGFNIVVAHDGEQALSLLDSSVDLLLLDIMMPKKNGIDTLKELRQHHQTPVIMLTARGSELDRVLGTELGADDYLPKPFNDRELVARIRAILRRSNWSEQQQQVDSGAPTLDVDGLQLNPGRPGGASFDGGTGSDRHRIHPALPAGAASRRGCVARTAERGSAGQTPDPVRSRHRHAHFQPAA